MLPYGSAVPTDAWKAIEAYLQHGGNLLVLGGQPLRVPVTQAGATFTQDLPQDTYSRALDLLHTYEVPVARDAHFAWRPGYAFETTPKVQAEKFFTVEGHLNGLGYMMDPSGLRVAAPVIVIDRASGGRIVCLDFQPTAGYWESQDGGALIRQVRRLRAPGFHQPFRRDAVLCPPAERVAPDHGASAASETRQRAKYALSCLSRTECSKKLRYRWKARRSPISAAGVSEAASCRLLYGARHLP